MFKLYFDYGIRTETFLEKKLIMWSCRKKNFFKFLKITFFVKSSPPPLGLPTRSVIFYHMTLILFAIHSFDLGQCLISYFMLISHTENFLDTLKVWSKRDFCKFAPPLWANSEVQTRKGMICKLKNHDIFHLFRFRYKSTR